MPSPIDLYNLILNSAPPGSNRPGMFAPPPIDPMADELAFTQLQNQADQQPGVPFIPDQAAGIQGQNTGDSFFNRLGQMGPNPFPIMHGGFDTPGAGILPLLSLLAGFGNSVANRSGQQQQQRQKSAEDVKQHASGLANRRWEMFRDKQKSEADRVKANLEATERARRDAAAQVERDKDNTRSDKHLAISQEQLALARNKPGATEADTDAIGSWHQMLVSGEAQLSQVPVRLRSKVVQSISNSGDKIVPVNVRKAINEVSAARGIIDQIGGLSQTVNTGKDLGRFGTAGRRAVEGFRQSNPDVVAFNAANQGFLATLSRALGERGVLTEQDVARARAMLPGLADSRSAADVKLKQLRTFISGIENRAIKTYLSPNAGLGSPGSTGNVQTTSVDDEYVRSLGIK